MREFISRLIDLFRRDQLDRELREELQFHQQMLDRDNAGQARIADARLGNVTSIRERSRDRWSFAIIDQLQQDIRYALRGLKRSPGFTAAVLLTLGLGIGANASMFNVIDQLMFRPFPYMRDPSHVQRVYLRVIDAQRFVTAEQFPYARYLDLKRETHSFSDFAAFHPAVLAVGSRENSRERLVNAVSATFFSFFDAMPARGRFFVPADDSIPVGAPVAVISYDFWQREMGARDVIGQSLLVNNVSCTIVGVAPKGFVGVAEGTPPDVYVPITLYAGNEPGGSSKEYWSRYRWDMAEMMVRRMPVVSSAQANSDLTAAFRKSREKSAALNNQKLLNHEKAVAIAGPLKTASGPYPTLESRTLVWVSGVAMIVLFIASANVANLFYARTMRRKREMALRLALGVSRRRLAQQSLTESLVFAMFAGVVGVAFAEWGGIVIRRLLLPPGMNLSVSTDWRTLSVTMFSAIAAGVLTSLGPVVMSSREDYASTLKSGARSGTYRKSLLRNGLLVSQGALSVVLLVGAGLFVQSLLRVERMRLGYDVNPVLLVQWSRRGATMSTDERIALRNRVLQVATQLPGVQYAAWASNVPMQGTSTTSFFVPGIESVEKLGRFTYQSATADYFKAMDTHIIRGRAFTTQDRVGTPGVIIVGESVAKLWWPNKDAIGQCVRFGADTVPCSSVIGVAEDAVHDAAKDEPLRVYISADQHPSEGGSQPVLRMTQPPAVLAESVRRALQAEMPGQQYVTVQPMAQLIGEQRRSWSVGATMFVAFGVLAVIVAAVGLYGVISYAVTQRQHELGVRVALGARDHHVVSLVVGEGIRLAGIGVVAGIVMALFAAPFIQPLLFQQSARDPLVFGAVALLLLLVSTSASALPAFRATRANPNVVLRGD